MKKSIQTLVVLILLGGCHGSSIRIGAIEDQNLYHLKQIQMGMNEPEVRRIMGSPYKTESRTIDSADYDIWFYVTKTTYLVQSEILSRNLTPLVFKRGVLEGWGNTYYNYLLDLDNAKGKRSEERRQKYSNDRHEWPSEDHRSIPGRLPHEMDQERQTPGPSLDMFESEDEEENSDSSSSPCDQTDKGDVNWW